MRSNILGGRTIVRGNVVNIAVDIAPTVNKLPRDMNELHTVAVTYKHKLQYKKCEFRENVRPFVVWRAAHYLVKNSCVFKENEVDLDTNWFANAIMCETDENKTEETLQITDNEHMNTEMSDVDESSNSNKNDEDDMNIRDKYEEVSDDDYEILPLDKENCLKVYFVMMMQSIWLFLQYSVVNVVRKTNMKKCIIVMYVNMNYDQLINELQKMFQIYFSNLKKSS